MYTIMLVDDDPFIVDGLNVLVNWDELNLNVVAKAHSGEEAYNLYQQHPVDIIITDIKMPGMSGIEFIKKLKAEQCHCKFIILSGFNDFEYLKEGIRLGVDNYLTKPVNIDELKSTLKTSIDALNQSFSINTTELNLLLNTILYRCVTGNIAREEVISRAELLHIPIHSSHYLVTLIRGIPDQSNILPSSELMYNACKNCTEIQSNAMIFNDLSGDLVLIFHSNTNQSDFLLLTHKLLDRLITRFKIKNYPVQITRGSVVHSFHDLKQSYAQALTLFDYFLIHPEKNLLTPDAIIPPSPPHTFDIDHDYISDLITSCDLDGLNLYIDNLFNNLLLHSVSNPDIPRIIVVEIFTHIRYTKSHLLNHSTHFTHDVQFFSTLHDITDLNTLKRHTQEILTDIIQQISQQNQDMNPIICEMIKHTLTHLSDDLSLKEYALKYHINATYLGQLFKQETGLSFPKYLNSHRIEKAKILLRESHCKTADIAKKVGYSDPNYFYRIFKTYVGISPSEFKKK